MAEVSEDVVAVSISESGVATIRLQNGKVNALSRAVLRRLRDIAIEFQSSPPKSVVVTGSDRIFAAGAEISEFAGPDEAAEIGLLFTEALCAVAAIPRVVIAAVSGPALGGGCELALACDLRIASSTAKFGQPEILLGIIPGGGGTQRLVRTIGVGRAKEMIFSGRQVRADEALQFGLVNEVVDAEQFAARVQEIAEMYANGPLQAQALAKAAIDNGLDQSLAEGLRIEQKAFIDVFATGDAEIGVQSFLANGPGAAKFTGR